MSISKKSLLSLLLVGSSSVFAGTMGTTCDSVNATAPCKHTAWELGANALYLQPSLGVANIHGRRLNANGTSEFVNFDPQYAWGFEVEGAYQFNTGNDLSINWYRTSKSTSRSYGPHVTVENASLAQDAVSINPTWNAVNLELGQRVTIGELKSIRIHGGVEYANITTDWSAVGSPVSSPSVVVYPQINRSFNGFGPRLGADLSYDWVMGLGVYANTATTLLVGTQGITSVFVSTSSASTTAVVPELEAKFGAKYTYPMATGKVTLDLGWMWVNYFDAILSDKSDAISKKPDVYTSNFGLQGLFFGLKWAGDMA